MFIHTIFGLLVEIHPIGTVKDSVRIEGITIHVFTFFLKSMGTNII